ncbi:MAG: OmpH family outer membrane protein [Deltaproteobacteria bacterium]|jgi:Skp family chaperone for outer membrane proteins|nr:OmpH family outer membrane protein [Deltaproteobacteria bacterium]
MPITKKLPFRPVFLALALALVFCLAGSAQAQNVGVVDLRKAVVDSKPGKAAFNKLKAKFDSLKKSLEVKQKELEKKENDLKNQASALNQDAFEKKRSELANDIRNFQEQTQRAQEEMEKAETDSLKPLYEKAEQTASRLAAERGFSIVIHSNAVIFAQSTIDITTEITKALDK